MKLTLSLYSRENCPHCVTAKNKLDDMGIQYEEFEFGRNAVLEDFKMKYPEVRTVPAFFINGVFVGGSDKLQSIITMLGETHE